MAVGQMSGGHGVGDAAHRHGRTAGRRRRRHGINRHLSGRRQPLFHHVVVVIVVMMMKVLVVVVVVVVVVMARPFQRTGRSGRDRSAVSAKRAAVLEVV